MRIPDELVVALDKVLTTCDLLTRAVRQIFYVRQITNEEFARRHRASYIKNRQGKYSQETINCDRSNKLRVLTTSLVTWSRTIDLMDDMDLNIVNISISIEDKQTGEVHTYNSSDSIEEIEKKMKMFKKDSQTDIVNWQ